MGEQTAGVRLPAAKTQNRRQNRWAKRRYATIDGCPPSLDKIIFEIKTFDPVQALFRNDRHEQEVLAQFAQHAFSGPRTMCGACDHEIAFAEAAPLLFLVKPSFPKAKQFTIVGGAICDACASLPHDQMMDALCKNFREISPDAETIRAQ